MDEAEHLQADDEICMSSIFPIGQDVKECISHAVDSIGLKEIPSYDITMQDHVDWIKEAQESFNPVEVTDGLWIVPEWRKPPLLKFAGSSSDKHNSESWTGIWNWGAPHN